MIFEYLIDIIHTDEHDNYLGGDYTYNRLWWGEDEYDALNGLMEKYVREKAKENIEVKFHLCRVRPTGREAESLDDITPYIHCDVRPYIKGLITRFINRFIVADSIIELDKYKMQFEDYLLKYKDEFPEEVIQILYDQYKEQKTNIENGTIKPLSYTIVPPPYPVILREDYISNQLADILKGFGFRIKSISNIYEVEIPIFYKTKTLIASLGNKQIYKMNSLDLVLLWRENIKEWTSETDRIFYNISDLDTSVVIFLGDEFDSLIIDVVMKELLKSGISPIKFHNDYDYTLISILPQQIKMVKPLIPLICKSLFVDEYDLPTFFNEVPSTSYEDYDVFYRSGGGCVFCGSRTTGGGQFCSTCAGNID